MAHFALLDSNNIVVFVTVGPDDADEVEISTRTGSTYKQTSYNTHGGIHYASNTKTPDGGVALRANYAGIGYTYDPDNDVFYAPRPQDYNGVVCASWTISTPTWQWQPPEPRPTDPLPDGSCYVWDETETKWITKP